MKRSLFEICHHNDLLTLKNILPHCNPNVKDHYENNILHYACYFSKDSLVEYLIRTLPRLHYETNQSGNTFLHILIRQRRYALVHYTLKYANMYYIFDDPNRDGETIERLLQQHRIHMGYGQLGLYYYQKSRRCIIRMGQSVKRGLIRCYDFLKTRSQNVSKKNIGIQKSDEILVPLRSAMRQNEFPEETHFDRLATPIARWMRQPGADASRSVTTGQESVQEFVIHDIA